MFQKKPNTFYVYLAFVALAMAAYWQVAFLQNSLKWDLIDCYLPWRFHVGECLQNGVFPYWNPYTHCGYPIHADLRSVWYPETFLVGLTTGYTNLTLHLLFIIHISLAGLGMYLLSTHFTKDWRASFLAGIAYLLSGFFTGHGQEMFGMIAATWIPFVLFYYIRLLIHRQTADVLLTTLFAFLLITGGYQAMWAIMLYLMLTLFIVYFIRDLRNSHKKEAWQLVKMNGLLALITGLSLTIIAVTYFQVSPHLGRLGGVTLADAWFMPFSPRSAISFLIPFATVKDAAWYDTDISMNNAYAGLIVLMFFILSLFMKRGFLLNVFLLFGLVALLASFGKYTPVRAILFYIFPLLDLFRHSSFFSYFALVAIVLAASSGLGNYLASPGLYRKKLLWITFATGMVIIVLLVWALTGIDPETVSFTKPADDFAAWLMAPSRFEHVIVHSLLQLIFLSIFMVFVCRRPSVKFTALTAVLVVEMLVAVQLNIYYTVVSPGIDPLELSENIRQRAPGFPLPQPGVPVSLNSEVNSAHSVLWKNTNIFNKTVSFEGFNSFRLKGFESLADSFPQLAAKVLQNEVVFLSDTIQLIDQGMESGFNSDKTALYVDHKDFSEGFPDLKRSPDDSVRITEFYPGHFVARVKAAHPVAVTLLQGWYPGWKVTIDGKEAPVFVSNRMFISTICQAGSHEISFSYSNVPVIIGFAISYLVVLIVLSWLILISFRQRKRSFRLILIAFVWMAASIPALARFSLYSSYQQNKEKEYQRIAEEVAKSGLSEGVFNVDDKEMMRQALEQAGYQGNAFYYNLTYQSELSRLIDRLDTLAKYSTFDLVHARMSAPSTPEEIAAFSRWAGYTKKSVTANGELFIRSDSPPFYGILSVNDFEQAVDGWNGPSAALDSLHRVSGKYSNRIDSLSHGSFAFKWMPFEGEPGQGIPMEMNFRVFARARVKGDFSGASLIMQQRRQNKIVGSFSTGSGTWQVSAEKWTIVAKAGIFPNGFKPGDELLVFFWGNGKSTFYIDDFSVDVRFFE
ncbi:MAG: hypothetical protein AB9834_22655 [Lentimicrobium sp.]